MRYTSTEGGVDVNGRFDLNAVDDLIAYDPGGDVLSTRPNVSIDSAHRTDTGVFASIDASVTPLLTLGGGVRGDYVTTANRGGYFGDRSTSQGAGSGYASATIGGSLGVSGTVQIARGFRDPVLSDRYYRGPTGRGFITGNPDLAPETSTQLDLAIRYTASQFRVAAFYYRYRIDDRSMKNISPVRTPAQCSPPDDPRRSSRTSSSRSLPTSRR